MAKRVNIQLQYAGIQCPDDKPYIEAFLANTKLRRCIATNIGTTLKLRLVGSYITAGMKPRGCIRVLDIRLRTKFGNRRK